MKHRTRKGKTYEWDTSFEGVVNNLQRRHRETESNYVRSDIERYMASRPCQSCAGRRLRPEALAVTICGVNIIDATDRSIGEALEWTRTIGGEDSSTNGAGPGEVLTQRELTIASQILKEIQARLLFLLNIGLDYLTLSRTASTLSGGEAQRIRLATQIGSGLMGVLYVCDEPSIGLHPADDHRLIKTLKRLRDLGNTVLIVEHDEAIMRAAGPYRRPWPRSRGARRPRRCQRPGRGGRRGPRLADRTVPQPPAADRAAPVKAAKEREVPQDQGSQAEQPEGHRRRDTAGSAGLHNGCLRLRQEQR